MKTHENIMKNSKYTYIYIYIYEAKNKYFEVVFFF